MDLCLGAGGFGIELHCSCFHTHNGPSVSGEENVGNLGDHGVGKILDHEAHAVSFGPAGAQDRAGLGLASLESNAGPSQLASEANEAPVMGAFVEEKRLAA